MSGKELKEILAARGINLSELARMLGFANDQRLHSVLNAADIKTGFLERIVAVTGIPLSYFYPNDTTTTITNESSELHVRNNSGVVSGTNNGSISTGQQDTQKLVEMLVESNAKKDQQIDKLIALLTKQQ